MKILLDIYIPSISEHYDIMVPDFLPIKEIIPLIARAVEELSNRRYVSSSCELLCNAESGIILNEHHTPKEYGFQHGDHIMLF